MVLPDKTSGGAFVANRLSYEETARAGLHRTRLNPLWEPLLEGQSWASANRGALC